MSVSADRTAKAPASCVTTASNVLIRAIQYAGQFVYPRLAFRTRMGGDRTRGRPGGGPDMTHRGSAGYFVESV